MIDLNANVGLTADGWRGWTRIFFNSFEGCQKVVRGLAFEAICNADLDIFVKQKYWMAADGRGYLPQDPQLSAKIRKILF